MRLLEPHSPDLITEHGQAVWGHVGSSRDKLMNTVRPHNPGDDGQSGGCHGLDTIGDNAAPLHCGCDGVLG